jgi:hypothetical protein
MKKTRKVTIQLTNKIVGSYEARSYPHDDLRGDKKIQLYRVPLYEIKVFGEDDKGKLQTFLHKAPRFMPYWNNPQKPYHAYKAVGWLNSGLSTARKIVVDKYKSDYELHNRYSPGRGAIVMRGSFYIHAGPSSETEVGFGSAGCVEILGNFDDFKKDVASLSGFKATTDIVLMQLVHDKHLIVDIESASVPNIKLRLSREILATWN